MTEPMTLREFRSAAGYSGVGRVFKSSGALDRIFDALADFDKVRQAGGSRAIAAIRPLRRACVAFLGGSKKWGAAQTAASQLLEAATLYLEEESYFVHGGKHDAQVLTPGGGKQPQLQGAKVGGHRPHNVLDSHYADEKARGVHWGVTKDMGTTSKIQGDYAQYLKRGAGMKLSIGLFAQHVLAAHIEDDPDGRFIMRNLASRPMGLDKILHGVKYCTEEERAALRLGFQQGLLFGADGAPFDTRGTETMESGYGYAIFVIGFDMQMYAASHIPDQFHHSSFMSGEPVVAAGEIAAVGGELRFISNKTGHYKSGERELNAAIEYLGKRFVDRSRTVVQLYPEKRLFWATDWVHLRRRGEATRPISWSKKYLREPGETLFPEP